MVGWVDCLATIWCLKNEFNLRIGFYIDFLLFFCFVEITESWGLAPRFERLGIRRRFFLCVMVGWVGCLATIWCLKNEFNLRIGFYIDFFIGAQWAAEKLLTDRIERSEQLELVGDFKKYYEQMA